MHDIKWIRENAVEFDSAISKRGLPPSSQEFISLDSKRRKIQTDLQILQESRNTASKAIGKAIAQSKHEEAEKLKLDVSTFKNDIRSLEDDERKIVNKLEDLLSGVPNLPAKDVPIGSHEKENIEIRKWGDPKLLPFSPKQHFELGSELKLMDFESSAAMSGARFVVLSGALARLERALGAFMLDVHTNEFGYSEISPPYLVRNEAAFGTGNLPKFADDLFSTNDGYILIPTAEMPLTNLVREQVLNPMDLPLRFTAYTPCFRAEAGAAGKDTRGMIRQHQFGKVELVSITIPEDSDKEHERMTACAESILQRLDLPYRVVTLCTGDLGFSANKTYDLEVWLPGQSQYREISSCSNCGDFQARRMNTRIQATNSSKTTFIHTLNGSGLAVGRALIAVIENFQNSDGSITIPPVLRNYMGGLERIE